MGTIGLFFHGSWEEYSLPAHCSPIWHKIVSIGHRLQFQFQWLIGNGHGINAWKDPWLSNIPLCQWPSYANVAVDLSIFTVADFILPNNSWNMPVLATMFSRDMSWLSHLFRWHRCAGLIII